MGGCWGCRHRLRDAQTLNWYSERYFALQFAQNKAMSEGEGGSRSERTRAQVNHTFAQFSQPDAAGAPVRPWNTAKNLEMERSAGWPTGQRVAAQKIRQWALPYRETPLS